MIDPGLESSRTIGLGAVVLLQVTMHTSNEIVIRSSYSAIFSLAARIEDWGHILPHYRYVRILRRRGNHKLARMSAWRNFIPVTWSAVQTVEAGDEARPGRILFHHVKGLVRGMDVEWSFHPMPDGAVLVRIAHRLGEPPFPTRLLGPRLTDLIVGRAFIGYIAAKTLERVKELAERNL